MAARLHISMNAQPVLAKVFSAPAVGSSLLSRRADRNKRCEPWYANAPEIQSDFQLFLLSWAHVMKSLLCRSLGSSFAAAVLSLALCAQAGAAPILDVRNGILFGASGVIVNGVSYSVAFRDGNCAGLYGGCASSRVLPFRGWVAADHASYALLEQVFLDGELGAFDSKPWLINGCGNQTQCAVMTPKDVVGGEYEGWTLEFYSSDALNSTSNSKDKVWSNDELITWNSSANTSVWAVWSVDKVTAQSVPEPASIALVGIAGLALGWTRRRCSTKR